MKTVEQLQECIRLSEVRIRTLNKEAMELLGVRPYTDAVARQEKAKYREIEKEQDKIAELRQSIIYIQTTPPRGIEESYNKTLAQLNAIEREVAQWEGKEMKKEIRNKRSYSKVKAQFKRLQFLMS